MKPALLADAKMQGVPALAWRSQCESVAALALLAKAASV